MIISYYIPEDGDSPEHPNFFVCDSNSLSVGQLKKIFPVPGEYHFRFKKLIGSTSVWMDATNDAAPVPIDSNGNAFSKVSRITLRGVNTTQVSQKVVSQQQEILVPTSPQNEPSKPASQPVEKTRERRNSDKLLSFDNFDEPAPAPAPAAAFHNDFLDFSTTSSISSSIPVTNKPVDFFGFDDLSSQPSNPPLALSSSVPRTSSGSSMPSLSYPSQGQGQGSPMSMGRPMGAGPGQGLQGGAGRGIGGAGPGAGGMTFDPFANMAPAQQQPYRQGGRR